MWTWNLFSSCSVEPPAARQVGVLVTRATGVGAADLSPDYSRSVRNCCPHPRRRHRPRPAPRDPQAGHRSPAGRRRQSAFTDTVTYRVPVGARPESDTRPGDRLSGSCPPIPHSRPCGPPPRSTSMSPTSSYHGRLNARSQEARARSHGGGGLPARRRDCLREAPHSIVIRIPFSRVLSSGHDWASGWQDYVDACFG